MIERAIHELAPSAVELSEEARGREIDRADATAATAPDGANAFAPLDTASVSN